MGPSIGAVPAKKWHKDEPPEDAGCADKRMETTILHRQRIMSTTVHPTPLYDQRLHFDGETDFYRGKVRDVHTMEDGRLLDGGQRSDFRIRRGVAPPDSVQGSGAEPACGAHAAGGVGHRAGVVRRRSGPQRGRRPPLRADPLGNGHPRSFDRSRLAHVPGWWSDVVRGGPAGGHAGARRLSQPIITPATKAEEGHDEDISKEDILAQGIVSEARYAELERITRALFARGQAMAAERGFILVDTKYEFGLHDGELMLMDEVHTPDSSRYFHAEGMRNGRRQESRRPS